MSEQTKEIFFKGYDIAFTTNLSIYAKVVYFYLCKCKNNLTNKCNPCHFTISKNANCSVSMVQRAIKELESAKLVQKTNCYNSTRKGKNAQTSNEYTVYSKPYDQIEITSEIGESREEATPEINIPTPTVQDTDITKVFINPLKPKENKSINLSNSQSKKVEKVIKPNKAKQIDKDDNILQDLQSIFQNCNLKLYNKPSQNIIKSSVVNMYCNESFSKKNKIPIELIRDRLCHLKMQIIDQALSDYATAVESQIKIYSHNLYFEKVLWNSIVSSSLDEYMSDVV